MTNNAVFNVAVCIMGILILSIHIVNLLLKKQKRKDEKRLLDFFVFTVVHFATYLTFSFVKTVYTSDAYIIGFYTTFYIMNNIEVLMLFKYMRCYAELPSKKDRVCSVVNLSLFAAFVILDLVNIFTGIFFTAENGVYLRSKTMILSQGYQFAIFLLVFVLTVRDQKLNAREKTAFALYCFLPLIAIIVQNIFKGYAIAYASVIVSIEVLFFFVNIQKNIDLANEEEKNKDAQIRLMLSQIKPHFVYNSLSAISTLIPLDPEKAQKALDNFTEYLRHNLASLTATRLIPFEDELRHIETYISLEKMRFGDRLRVNFDVQSTDFFLPPLTIQPLVENAVKHGVLKKMEGGTITVQAREEENAFVVRITDDGVGFSAADVAFDENKHFGIRNTQYRLAKTCGAELSVKSEIGTGTEVTVVFFKEKK